MKTGKKLELVVMLTWHDVTVPYAKELFLQCRNAPARRWGFKNVGLDIVQMQELAGLMREAGKSVYLEVIDPDPEHGPDYVKLCSRCGIDTLLGSKYSPLTLQEAKDAGILWYPFVGRPVNGLIEGSIEEIASEAAMLEAAGADGINLSLFRYNGNEKELLNKLREKCTLPLCVPGSIHSREQIEFLMEQKIELFTIGGAFFEKQFSTTFEGGIQAVAGMLDGA